MNDIALLMTVKVLEIRHPQEFYNLFKINQRAPQVGDTGAVVDVLNGFGKPNRYVVECCDLGGKTIWLSDFSAEELGPNSSYMDSPNVQETDR